MKITILNGNPNTENRTFDNYLDRLSSELEAEGHTVTTLELRAMNIRYCTGCFGCWQKTPGECGIVDKSRDVCRAAINSDFVLWASPVIMGFYSALLKKATDKYIPLLHPYAEIVNGEMRHKPRYDRYPLTGLLLQKGEDTDDEDIRIISDIHHQTALDFKSSVLFTKLTHEPVEDVACAISLGCQS